MKVFVTGVSGQLGHDVMFELVRRGHTAWGTARRQPEELPQLCGTGGEETAVPLFRALDLTEETAVKAELSALRPDAIIHCAAWTAVDAAERAENIPLCRAVNVDGTANLAAACRESGARLIHVSSDYVFSGEGTAPWTPECADLRPVNVYGHSKLDAERATEAAEQWCVLRTSWLFGEGESFLRSLLHLARERDRVRVVSDQIGAPTFAPDLARLLVDLSVKGAGGVYHATNEGGYVSRYELAGEIFRLAGISASLEPVTTAEFARPGAAPRPLNSRLDTTKLARDGFAPLPDRHDALRRSLARIG